MKKILFLILSACCLSACSEFLDREPENAVTFSNYFKNEKEVQTAVESMHATFRACFGSNGHLISITSMQIGKN